jgi:hypothetical protein
VSSINRARVASNLPGSTCQTPTVAANIVRDFTSRYDAPFLADVDAAKKMSETSTAIAAASFNLATGTFPVSRAAGKKVVPEFIRNELQIYPRSNTCKIDDKSVLRTATTNSLTLGNYLNCYGEHFAGNCNPVLRTDCTSRNLLI